MFNVYVVCPLPTWLANNPFKMPPLFNVSAYTADADDLPMMVREMQIRPPSMVIVSEECRHKFAPVYEYLPPAIRRIVRFRSEVTSENVLGLAMEAADMALEPQRINPKVSVFTPFHKTPFDVVKRTVRSMEWQTYSDWEWVILHDSEPTFTLDALPPAVRARTRYVGRFDSGRIGWLKGVLCAAARGRYLVEFDHDDELAPHALQRIADAFDDTQADFVYSRFAEVMPNGECNEYGAPYWEYDSFETDWGGNHRTFRVGALHDFHGTFPFNGKNEPTIFHMGVCPNHVRAFRRDSYFRIGGYRDLPWCDDYDILCRLWLHGRSHGINDLLYVQHLAQSTWTQDRNLLTHHMGMVLNKYRGEINARL